MSKKRDAANKLFVLDTNVLMHDPSSLFRFEEHDIYLPMVTLEELDNNKKGMTEVARNARQASRNLEEIVGGELTNLEDGCPLAINGNKHLSGRLFLQTHAVSVDLPMLAGGRQPDTWCGMGFTEKIS
jgi:PhoH-like ATPase